MHRAVAIVLGLLLASPSAQASALHTHAYTDHDHPEHHHGLAVHDHHQLAPHHDQDDDAVHIEPCDPGQHAIGLTIGCAPLLQTHAIDLVSPSLDLAGPLAPFRSVSELTDVRVHGPPPRTQGPPRAPPLIFPA